MSSNWYIQGTIIHQDTGEPLNGLKVELWERDAVDKGPKYNPGCVVSDCTDDHIKDEVTDEDGRVNFCLGYWDWHDSPYEEAPYFYFKIYDSKGFLLKSTFNSLLFFPCAGTHQVKIEVRPHSDGDEQPSEDEHSVSGNVLQHDRTPAQGYTVKAYDRKLGGRTALGEMVTNEDGFFQIIYTQDMLFGKLANLEIEVFEPAADPSAEPVLTSGLISPAPQHLKLSFLLEADTPDEFPSEFHLVHQRVGTELDGLDLTSVTNAELIALAGKIEVEFAQLQNYATSRLLVESISQPGVVVPQPFYGLFRNKLPQALGALAEYERDELQEVILKAIDDETIGKDLITLGEELNNAELVAAISAFLDALFAHIDIDVVPVIEDEDFLTQLLGLVIDDAHQAERGIFVEKFKQYKSTNPTFWEVLKQASPFFTDSAPTDVVPQLKFIFFLSALTLDHFDLIEYLYQTQGLTRPRQVVDYSFPELSASDWNGAVDAVGAPSSMEAAPYKEHLYYAAIDAYYNAKLIDLMKLAQQVTPGLFEFYTVHFNTSDPNTEHYDADSKFDLRINDVVTYLTDRDGTLDANAAKELKNFEKMYRLLPGDKIEDKFSVLKALWNKGFQTSTQIIAEGEQTFVAKVSEEIESTIALETYQHFSSLHGEETFFALELKLAEHEYNHIFGLKDSCKLEYSKSALGPYAYLQDCLTFLKKADPEQACFKELDSRRPGISRLTNSHQSSMTPMPYVDLTNEIFELIIAGRFVPGEMDEYKKYLTTHSAEELKVEPDIIFPAVHKKAYKTLRDVTYPWNFDLWSREATIYLGLAGVPRHRLTEVCRMDSTDGAQNQIDMLDNACRYLGLSEMDQTWVTKPFDPAGSQEEHDLLLGAYYGHAPDFENVARFLKKTFMTYDELLTFIDCSHLLSSLAIKYDSTLPCDIDGAVFKVNITRNWIVLYRARLIMRKTGWSAKVLDKSVQLLGIDLAPNNGIGENVIQLAALNRLETELNLDIELLLDYWRANTAYQKLFIDNHLTKALGIAKNDYSTFKEFFGFQDPNDTIIVSPSDLLEFTKSSSVQRDWASG